MLRKPTAVLLVVSWFVLAAFDVLEDLELADPAELHSSSSARASGHGATARFVNNIVESADHPRIRLSNLLEQPAACLSISKPTAAQKTSKLHKLHRVFLI